MYSKSALMHYATASYSFLRFNLRTIQGFDVAVGVAACVGREALSPELLGLGYAENVFDIK